MIKNVTPPWIAKQMVGNENALSGIGKLIFTNSTEGTLFGGIVRPSMSKDITNIDGNEWNMTVGTFIWLPAKYYILKHESKAMCTLEQLLMGGLNNKEWKENNLT